MHPFVVRFVVGLGVLFGAVALVGCSNPQPKGQDGGGGPPDMQLCAGQRGGDEDGDGISNGEEGCASGRDSDGDGIPDWRDRDSDGDTLPDDQEAGTPGRCRGASPETWPCDTDSDGIPDYRDIDSDGDGLLDGDEDTNADGLLGCCIERCGQAAPSQSRCELNKHGCSGTQTCQAGRCAPAETFSCSNGETDPYRPDTFGDGKNDSERGTFICRTPTPARPHGRRVVQKQKSSNPAIDKYHSGDWHIALEPSATYTAITVATPKPKEAVAYLDHPKVDEQVAGFILSLPPRKVSLELEFAALGARLLANVPGRGTGASPTLQIRALGQRGKSHDRYDIMRGTTLDIRKANATPAEARDQLVAAILGRPVSDLSDLPPTFGAPASELVVRLSMVRRFAFKRTTSGTLELDAAGYPVPDDQQPGQYRIVVMGAVVSTQGYRNPSNRTRFILDDLADGTALARWSAKVAQECDVGIVSRYPTADIIWVIDESGSTDDNRNDIIANANSLFTRALAAGLDFRMGVTGLEPESNTRRPPPEAFGVLCQGDRFLAPHEKQLFTACIKDPPGMQGGTEHGLVSAEAAVRRHLPRDDSSRRIRKGADLVLIIATDELPHSIRPLLSYQDPHQHPLAQPQQTAVDVVVARYASFFKGESDPEAKATVHLIGGVPGNSCNAEIGHGYLELVRALGGQVADVCQADIGPSLDAILDDIVGSASPMPLDKIPIAVSLAVAVDGVAVHRGHQRGFVYHADTNGLVFINTPFDVGSAVVSSYEYWVPAL